jgi:enamine deaminase RidA (YjgF/YER057c/UK114 family)
LSDILRLGGDPPSPYEERYGFCRLVAVDGTVFVGGTTSVTPDGAVLGETPAEQTREILRKIIHELGRVGATAADVVLVRIYVTDISYSQTIGEAHGDVFGEVRPVMSMLEVSGFVDPRMLVEIEAVAILSARS